MPNETGGRRSSGPDDAVRGLSRRVFLQAAVAGAAGAALGGGLGRAVAAPAAGARAGAAAAPAKKPNIILAMTDDQGWGDVGYNGHQILRTPTLDEMAARGVRLNRFYAAAPVCSPTRGSCMTGRHPNRYGVFSWGYDMPLAEATIAEAVKRAGYATGHFGKWHLGGIPTIAGKGTRTNRGKVKHARPPHPGNQGFDEWFSYWNFFDLNPPAFHHNGRPVGKLTGDGSDITVDRALRWIREVAGRKQPFLAVVWFGNPHSPHRALETDRAAYRSLPERQQHYLGEITGVDRAMGTLRKGLRELGIAEDTLLWFTSDNGATAAGSNGPLRGRKASLWEGGVRVPGILEWPARVRKPFATDVPACTSDYYPTTLELLGLDVPSQPKPLDGVSLLPLIDGKMTRRPKPIAFEIRAGKGNVRWATLVTDRYKLHKGGGGRRGQRARGAAAALSLYDLAADPAEKKDLAAEHPDVVQKMKAELDRWQASVERSLAGEDYPTA
jgi:arylsulfatase A-like enzyme